MGCVIKIMGKYKIGIMQGRLTPMKGRGIQFFPFDNWREEFFSAEKIGIDEIEFIFDYENYTENPLWTVEGIEKLRELIKTTGVKVNAICFDYFMRRPFFKNPGNTAILKENKDVLRHILMSMQDLDIRLIEIPLVDASSMKTKSEKLAVKEFLCEFADEFSDIRFGLETDLPPKEFKSFLQDVGRVNTGANYDSGNSSGLGYDAYEEVTTLRDYIYNIHIKDRVFGGSTVALGTGSADFNRLFSGLKETDYSGSFILQAARGNEGQEQDNIVLQKEFVRKLIEQYL